MSGNEYGGDAILENKRFKSFWGYAVEDTMTGKKYGDDNTEELVDLLNCFYEKNINLVKALKLAEYQLKVQDRILEEYENG